MAAVISGDIVTRITMIERERRGLKLTLQVPGRKQTTTCYPRDEAEKASWTRGAIRRGYKIIG